jgi:hypothetical protein
MPLEPLICGFLIVVRDEVPELCSDDSSEEPAWVFCADDPSMLGSGHEFQLVGKRFADEADPHRFRVERHEPTGISQVSRNHVAERRRIFSPLPL